MGAIRADTGYTKPDPRGGGGLEGAIVTSHPLQAVAVFEPYERKVYLGKIDAPTGRFEFRGLPAGEYDLLIKVEGHVYEGITLETDLNQRIKPSELQAICDRISQMFFKTEDFFNRKHIVRLVSDGESARMFVVQTRTRRVLDPGGNPIHAYIRRFEAVDLVKTGKTWQITTSRHLLRQEVLHRSRDVKIKLTYSPALGGILVVDKLRDLGRIDLKKLSKPPKDRHYATATKHDD